LINKSALFTNKAIEEKIYKESFIVFSATKSSNSSAELENHKEDKFYQEHGNIHTRFGALRFAQDALPGQRTR
jgi:hypothetical protein